MGNDPEYSPLGAVGLPILAGSMSAAHSAQEVPGTYFIPKPIYRDRPKECSPQYRWQQEKLAKELCSICGIEPVYKGQRGSRCYALMRLRHAMKETVRRML